MTSSNSGTNSGRIHDIGVGLISVGWMGKLHTRSYQALPSVYPGLQLRPRLVHAVDTAQDRAEYARDVLGYETASTDYRDVLTNPDVDVVSICAPILWGPARTSRSLRTARWALWRTTTT